jgi:hypothetical protein
MALLAYDSRRRRKAAMPIDYEDDGKESTQILKRWITGAIMFVIGVVLGVGLERHGPVVVAATCLSLAGFLVSSFSVVMLQAPPRERRQFKKSWLVAGVVVGALVCIVPSIWLARR